MKRRLDVLTTTLFPAYVVWELTLRCDQRCTHCGSRADMPRAHELDEDQALAVVKDLIALKAREVVLIGGEAYLHNSFLTIARALHDGGIEVGVTTGGRGITRELACAMKSAGINRVSVSIDGTEKVHDLLRATKGSFHQAFCAIEHLHAAGIRPTVNTTISRLNKSCLEDLYAAIRDAGARAWQVQIIAPLGRAADRPDMLLQPYDLLEIMPRLAALKRQAFDDGIIIMSGNNLGYFGPDEALMRSADEDMTDYFAGCQAGRFIMGIESNGTIKGCPSLQTAAYAAGNVKEQALTTIWNTSPQLAKMRDGSAKELWGFCKTCDFREPCGGGCTFTAHSLFGKAGNNPYCFYRAGVMAKNGQRERLVRTSNAPGTPFDHALFRIELEDFHQPEATILPKEKMVQIRRKPY